MLQNAVYHDTDLFFNWHNEFRGITLYKPSKTGFIKINKAGLYHQFEQFKENPKQLMVHLESLKYVLEKQTKEYYEPVK